MRLYREIKELYNDPGIPVLLLPVEDNPLITSGDHQSLPSQTQNFQAQLLLQLADG